VGAQVGDVTLAARRPPTNDILDRARIEDVTLHDSSSNDRGGHQIDRHHRIRPVMVGASAAAPHDSGQAAGVQEHRGKRKGHEGSSGVHQGEGKRAKGDKDTTTSGTSESGKRDDTGSEGHQGGEPPGMTQGSACTGNDGAQSSSNAGESQGERRKHRSGARKNRGGKRTRAVRSEGRQRLGRFLVEHT
jgi:hypothetical protein